MIDYSTSASRKLRPKKMHSLKEKPSWRSTSSSPREEHVEDTALTSMVRPSTEARPLLSTFQSTSLWREARPATRTAPSRKRRSEIPASCPPTQWRQPTSLAGSMLASRLSSRGCHPSRAPSVVPMQGHSPQPKPHLASSRVQSQSKAASSRQRQARWRRHKARWRESQPPPAPEAQELARPTTLPVPSEML